MDYLIYILAICISAPLFLMMILSEPKSRRLLGFMILGISIAVLSSEVNTLLKFLFDGMYDFFHLTISITPISEEFLKSMPLIFVAVFITDRRDVLFSGALAIGLGFAVMENTFILLQNIETVSIFWAIIRGFSSGLMHALCTLVVGIGISMVRKRRKLFATGTFAFLAAATIYHSLFNLLIQSDYMLVGALLPIVTYIPLVYLSHKRKWNIV